MEKGARGTVPTRDGRGSEAEPTDHRPPIGRIRGHFWRADLVRPPARGLRLNAAGEQLVPAAESVENAVLTLERRRAAASPVLSGAVRVSTGECAAGFPARCLSGSTTTALPSGITLELVESRQTANLARREADMALRHEPPESGDFYIAKAGTFACAVYRRSGADADAWVT